MSTQSVEDYKALADLPDAPELAALARAELPSMTSLHEEAGWQRENRFGRGDIARGNFTLLLRDGAPDGQLIGFIWVDDAMLVDKGILEPWWCINALAVSPSFRGRGRGSSLVADVAIMATLLEIDLLYGQSVRSAIPFWKKLGFLIAATGEPVRTHAPARTLGREPVNYSFAPGSDDRFFVKYLTKDLGSVNSGLLPSSYFPTA